MEKVEKKMNAAWHLQQYQYPRVPGMQSFYLLKTPVCADSARQKHALASKQCACVRLCVLALRVVSKSYAKNFRVLRDKVNLQAIFDRVWQLCEIRFA